MLIFKSQIGREIKVSAHTSFRFCSKCRDDRTIIPSFNQDIFTGVDQVKVVQTVPVIPCLWSPSQLMIKLLLYNVLYKKNIQAA